MMIPAMLAAVLLAPALAAAPFGDGERLPSGDGVLLAAAGPKENPVKDERSDFFGSGRYESPKDWEEEKEATPEPSLRLSRGLNVIKVRLFGGKGSRYNGPADYLVGFEATTMGKPPVKAKPVKVSGVKTWLYKHGYPVNLGDPSERGQNPPALADEYFCIVPHGRKFFVFSYAYGSPAPDPEREGEKAWETFLAEFSIKKR